jgi:hypothetical protein
VRAAAVFRWLTARARRWACGCATASRWPPCSRSCALSASWAPPSRCHPTPRARGPDPERITGALRMLTTKEAIKSEREKRGRRGQTDVREHQQDVGAVLARRPGGRRARGRGVRRRGRRQGPSGGALGRPRAQLPRRAAAVVEHARAGSEAGGVGPRRAARLRGAQGAALGDITAAARGPEVVPLIEDAAT